MSFGLRLWAVGSWLASGSCICLHPVLYYVPDTHETLIMPTTTEETTINRKTREFCQTLLDEPDIQALRQRIDTFMADEQARSQYEGLVSKGQVLHEKQQNSQQLTGEEISDFERDRESLFRNPVARGYLDAQHELQEMQQSITRYVSKAIELGRLPSEEDLDGGCCGHNGCGCSH
jgi:cell fate (sporulation/competence/biofilm development) regulator YlbF (YheA/YmcA/DUF963 family)